LSTSNKENDDDDDLTLDLIDQPSY